MRGILIATALIALSLPALAQEEPDFLQDALPDLADEAPLLPDAAAVTARAAPEC